MNQETHSPLWNSTTKLVVGLTLVALVAAMIVNFRAIVPPIVMAFILVYLLYPAAAFLTQKLRLKWGVSVNLIYLLLILVILGLLTIAGLEIVVQIQSLITLIESSLNQLPSAVDGLAKYIPTRIGPFPLDVSTINLDKLSGQLIDTAQATLGRTGEIIGTLASGAFNTLGWTVFVLLISYFVLLESGGLREDILPVDLPGYTADLQRMGKELGRIWNAFLRGQIILISVATLIYTVVLGGMGVSYALGLALMAGMARFLPYVGPFISWTVLALVTFFQPFKPFGMTSWVYMLVILATAWLIDGILDNIVSPRIMAESLKVHPAAVLVAAIVALDLLGLLGVVIAAPILATMQLLGRYILRKLFDRDPWGGMEENPAPPPLREQFRQWIEKLRAKLRLRGK
jgi:predicted PurR-regulated permease PerM